MGELAWLGIVRHGESEANVAGVAAESEGAELVEVAHRDPDVRLSERGREQAAAVRDWLRAMPAGERPTAVVASPYRRTVDTARIAVGSLGLPVSYDERLRDREQGVLDLLTRHGVRTRFPEEHRRRKWIGDFYYRPPGGESWADIALRLRGVLTDLRREHPDGRVLLVGHEAIVFVLRYLVEGLTEAELTAVTSDGGIRNCAVTVWARRDGALHPTLFNSCDHLPA
jgi:broad specificity phosphatase PhoE